MVKQHDGTMAKADRISTTKMDMPTRAGTAASASGPRISTTKMGIPKRADTAASASGPMPKTPPQSHRPRGGAFQAATAGTRSIHAPPIPISWPAATAIRGIAATSVPTVAVPVATAATRSIPPPPARPKGSRPPRAVIHGAAATSSRPVAFQATAAGNRSIQPPPPRAVTASSSTQEEVVRPSQHPSLNMNPAKKRAAADDSMWMHPKEEPSEHEVADVAVDTAAKKEDAEIYDDDEVQVYDDTDEEYEPLGEVVKYENSDEEDEPLSCGPPLSKMQKRRMRQKRTPKVKKSST
jgi:hypothetical protein